MKNQRILLLKTDLSRELQNLERLRKELDEVLSKLLAEPSFIEIRAIGSILHDFYSGVEKIFMRVAATLDEEVPKGGDWHLQLIERISYPVPGGRPALIDHELKEDLGEYLRFRHLFRNIYGFELRWKRLEELAKSLARIQKRLSHQIEEFFKFLDTLSNS